MSIPTDIKVGDVVYHAEYVEGGLTTIGPKFDGTITYVRYLRMQVIRVTPKGAWLSAHYFIGPYPFDQVDPAYRYWYSFGTRQYHGTKEGALEHLRHRRLANYDHCRRRMKAAELSLKRLGLDVPPERRPHIRLFEGDWP